MYICKPILNINDWRRYEFDEQRITQQVSDIVVYGKEEANRLQNDHIEPEHLLLGILRDGECKAAEILKSFYLDLKGIKNELETQLREKSILENYSQDISFS